ncbi:glycosyltransferase [Peribacillus muralis]|uniref:CgeB family protein n=1 Tax=Peribacillus muralis TaxID=264697 RepID=UPI00070D1A45|nr:glycosyltransferase [Peribacillus muralis]
MNILLISSGYRGVYPYFEQAIEEAFMFFNHTITKIDSVYTQETIKKVKDFAPDLIITLVGYKVDKRLMECFKKCGSILSVWLTEDPFYIDSSIEVVKDYDYIFTIDLGALEFYKKKFPEKNFFHLPLGTDPNLYQPSVTPIKYIYDLCLVGYPYPERIELVTHILNDTHYSLILVGPRWRKYIATNMERLTIVNKWVVPETVRNIFISSKIILNPHRTYDFAKNINTQGIESKSINNRTFDIAACGGFQLIPNKPDLDMHFNVSNEIVSYANNENCIELINHFLNNENSRNQYRKNAKERVLNSHTFFHRIQFILDEIS